MLGSGEVGAEQPCSSGEWQAVCSLATCRHGLQKGSCPKLEDWK